MALTSGFKLGPYEIVCPLGAGGMGEVYRATDTRLGRDVAIKILPAHLSSDPAFKTRFEREARTISSLSHPNICTLHDVGHQGGVDFLVLEYLEGQTLQQRLQGGSLPLKQVMEYGIQISEALARAHQAGIIHRDLKPGNIILTKTGAKLLDFGLAKPVALAAGMGAAGPVMPSTPTVSIPALTAQANPLTQQGTVVGTFQYLAPEILQGSEADARSDIFALGAVLYEMITGARAFPGKSQLSVMTAILEKEPERMAQVPSILEHVVHTCLAKDPSERWQSAHEVARELRWVMQAGSGSSAGVGTAATAVTSWRRWLTIAVAAMVLIPIATYYVTRPLPAPPWRVSVVPPAGVLAATLGRNGPPQISPDGSRIAFVGCPTASAAASFIGSAACSVWLQSFRSSEAHSIPGTSGSNSPFWSPDGRELGFFADGKLKAVSADGGPVRILCDAADGRGGSWGSAGTILFAPSRGSPIYRVPAEGGTPVAVTRSSPASSLAVVGSHRWPHFMPDGEHFTYNNEPNGACNDRTEIRFASLDGKQDSALVHTCSNATFANGQLIYWRDGNLVAQPFDPRRGALTGTPALIADHVAFDQLFGFAPFSASASGELLYRIGEGVTLAGLVWYDRGGKQVATLGQNDQYDSIAISPDGSRVVADVVGVAKANLLILDARGTRTLTIPIGALSPTWSADGRQIYFTSNPNGPFDIYVKAADGSGNEQAVVTFEKSQFGAMYPAASSDGKYLAYFSEDAATKRFHIYTIALTGDHHPQLFRASSSGNEVAPAFSPNNEWIAYESDQSGRTEVYVSPFPSGGAQYQVSTNGGERPVWRHDGREIYYRENLRMMAVKVDVKGGEIELGKPEALFEIAVRNLSGRWYDVSRDGRFLMNTSPPSVQGQNFELLINWPAANK